MAWLLDRQKTEIELLGSNSCQQAAHTVALFDRRSLNSSRGIFQGAKNIHTFYITHQACRAPECLLEEKPRSICILVCAGGIKVRSRRQKPIVPQKNKNQQNSMCVYVCIEENNKLTYSVVCLRMHNYYYRKQKLIKSSYNSNSPTIEILETCALCLYVCLYRR